MPRGDVEKTRWLPEHNTLRSLLSFSSHEGRVTIARYRALRNVPDSWLYRYRSAASALGSVPRPGAPLRRASAALERERRPSIRDRAVALAKRRGEVRTKDFSNIKVPRCYLSRMCEEGLLVRVGHGRYRLGPARSKEPPDSEQPMSQVRSHLVSGDGQEGR
ncbi:type IV toxin-antitoxin system AbiEi family antitoxin domain-containing protein [Sphingomonas tagetis]|uniref:type IV toxin-antitoxin system AbiEi family antitoxin domain-containing protein n=1 Tax=Sphingomonas tagetis TaxID=2949092 RepID=UPI00345E5ACB